MWIVGYFMLYRSLNSKSDRCLTEKTRNAFSILRRILFPKGVSNQTELYDLERQNNCGSSGNGNQAYIIFGLITSHRQGQYAKAYLSLAIMEKIANFHCKIDLLYMNCMCSYSKRFYKTVTNKTILFFSLDCSVVY